MVRTKPVSYVRSFSWPLQSHRLTLNINDLLLRLRDSKVEANLSLASSICHNLGEIKELYEGVNNLIWCPLSEPVLSVQTHRCRIEDAIEGSLALLDGCASAIDILGLMKESILELESSLRRKGGAEEKDINAYMQSRKMAQKLANKCLRNLQSVNVSLDKDGDHLGPVLRVLSGAQIACFSTVKSVIAYITSAKTRGTGQSLVAKLKLSKNIKCGRLAEASEIEKVDQTLLAFQAKKSILNAEGAQHIRKQLEALELAIQEIEDCLHSLSRCLLHTRVSLLNIVSH